MHTKDKRIEGDSSRVDASSHAVDNHEFDPTNPSGSPDRATLLNSGAARFMDREYAIEGQRRFDSGEGSSTASENVRPSASSPAGLPRPGPMQSQSRDTVHLGQSQSPSSDVGSNQLITSLSQDLSSQTTSDYLGIGSRKRRRALSPLNPSQSLPSRLLSHHAR